MSQSVLGSPLYKLYLRHELRLGPIISFMSSTLTPPPQRDEPSHGRSTKGQRFSCKFLSVRASWRLTCGTRPARTLPANLSFWSSK